MSDKAYHRAPYGSYSHTVICFFAKKKPPVCKVFGIYLFRRWWEVNKIARYFLDGDPLMSIVTGKVRNLKITYANMLSKDRQGVRTEFLVSCKNENFHRYNC